MKWHVERKPMVRLFGRLVVDEDGQSLTEYALILTLVAIAVVGVVALLGANGRILYEGIAPAFD